MCPNAPPLRRAQWTFVGLALLASCVIFNPTSAAQTRPNIVVFLIDDLGWTDVGCFGSRYYETPNIDRLARQGMRFTNAYSNGPNCAPTRACLMTGRYSPRHGVYTVGSGLRGRAEFRRMVPVENRTVLARSEVTIAERLKEAGYLTAHIGKWHLGHPREAGPLEQGFDVNIGGNRAGRPRSYFSPYRNPHLADGPAGEYLTDRLTDEALRFIETHRDRPFFLHLAHYAVHTPIQAKEKMTARYAKKRPTDGHRNAAYAAMIESVDFNIGRVLAKLDALELTKRTVVVFTSDNGGVGGYDRLGLHTRDITDNAPLRGGKGMLYEGGIRVPQIIRWPGMVRPGSVCDVPVASIDFHPTLLEIAGAEIDSGRDMDGKTLVPLLQSGGTALLKRDALFWHFPGYLEANARRGTWRTTPVGAVRHGDFKLIEFFEDGRLELYNLRDDIGEKRNLIRSMPDRAHTLRKTLSAWRQAVGAEMPKRRMPSARTDRP